MFTGLRPGEKLYEELYFVDEQRLPTDHPKVFCAMHRPVTVEAAEGVIAELSLVLDDPPEAIKLRLAELLPEYEQVRGDRPPPAPPKAHAK